MSDKSDGTTSFFISIMTALFVGLKLTGHIDWSWWWVLSPLWVPVALVLLLFLVLLVIGERL